MADRIKYEKRLTRSVSLLLKRLFCSRSGHVEKEDENETKGINAQRYL